MATTDKYDRQLRLWGSLGQVNYNIIIINRKN